MKRLLTTIPALLLVALCLSAQPAKKEYKPFYTKENAPHLEQVLPDPPGLEDPLFVNDLDKYNWGKSIRGTERGALAVRDAYIGPDYFMERFSPVMDHAMTPEANPVLYELLERAHRTEQQAGASAKKHFARLRPYQQYQEPSGMPHWENQKDHTSYPSGHTHASWVEGMILTAIDPAHTEGIMSVAYELGQSRVILGYHYQSDVEAGRIAGSITFARLCAIPEFTKLLQKAKDEYWGVKNGPKDWACLGCYRKDNEDITSSGHRPKVVFMGDSITEGWVRQDSDFFTDNDFAGRGISGQTSSHMLVRFRDDVVALHPRTVVILAGTNDLALNNGYIAMDDIMGNIISMCEIARANKIKPVLCSVIPASSFGWRPEAGDPSKDIVTLNGKIKAYADANKIKYVDYHSALKDENGGLAAKYGNMGKYGPDSVHPGLEGYKVMEAIILEALGKK